MPMDERPREKAERHGLEALSDAELLAIFIRTGIPGLAAPRDWTAEDTARAQVLWAADVAIEAIRSASNAMEQSPPDDYAADRHWPAPPA
jgi:hypothetical protein